MSGLMGNQPSARFLSWFPIGHSLTFMVVLPHYRGDSTFAVKNLPFPPEPELNAIIWRSVGLIAIGRSSQATEYASQSQAIHGLIDHSPQTDHKRDGYPRPVQIKMVQCQEFQYIRDILL
jgi:hypothetical protein